MFRKEKGGENEAEWRTPVDCFVKRGVTEYEYVGRYVMTTECKLLSDGELQRVDYEVWYHGIANSQWGRVMLVELGIARDEVEAALFSVTDVKKLFGEGKLCYWWQARFTSYLLRRRANTWK
jgi:hypothetical protein